MNTSSIQFHEKLEYSDKITSYSFFVDEGERQYTMLLTSDYNAGIIPDKLLDGHDLLKKATKTLCSQSSLKDRYIQKIQTSLITSLSHEDLATFRQNRNNLDKLPQSLLKKIKNLITESDNETLVVQEENKDASSDNTDTTNKSRENKQSGFVNANEFTTFISILLFIAVFNSVILSAE
jgi:hypothetical protein